MEFLPWMKNPNLLMPTVGFEPQPPSNSVVVITPRLAHRRNHSATEHWFFDLEAKLTVLDYTCTKKSEIDQMVRT